MKVLALLVVVAVVAVAFFYVTGGLAQPSTGGFTLPS